MVYADYTEALNLAIAHSGVLELFHEKYIEGHMDFTSVKISLQDFIKQLVELSVLLQKQQQESIEFTTRALSTKNDSLYLIEPKKRTPKSNIKANRP